MYFVYHLKSQQAITKGGIDSQLRKNDYELLGSMSKPIVCTLEERSFRGGKYLNVERTSKKNTKKYHEFLTHVIGFPLTKTTLRMEVLFKKQVPTRFVP